MHRRLLIVAAAAVLLSGLTAYAQRSGRGGDGQAGPPPTAKAAAPMDITGYWVSLVTDNWIFRVITPAKGDYRYLPISAEGRRVADTWDPAKDEASGSQCKGYGPVGVMRMPGRLHITWDNDNTMRLDTDTGRYARRRGASAAPSSSPRALRPRQSFALAHGPATRGSPRHPANRWQGCPTWPPASRAAPRSRCSR